MTADPTLPRDPVAVTIGVFDGVHRGHQDLISQMVLEARRRGHRSVCVTFDPDPAVVLHPESGQLALSSLAERTERLGALGVDHVEVVPFSRNLASETPEEFIAALQARFELRSLWVGADFALGRDRSGTVETLRAIGQSSGFEVVALELLRHDGRPISATWIRELLREGDVATCATLLGRPHCIGGPVVAGMQRGRQIGFPTANVVPPAGRACPADGVYFVGVRVQGSGALTGYGVVNLGARPTFAETERLLETYILDFNGDLYGTEIEVCFLQRLRGVRRFEGVGELKTQIERDVALAVELAEAQAARADS
jgi:riboflavin kinase/FMN adenylyltransferase